MPDTLLEKALVVCDDEALKNERALRSGVAVTVADTPIGSVLLAGSVIGSNVLPTSQFLRTVEKSITSMI